MEREQRLCLCSNYLEGVHQTTPGLPAALEIRSWATPVTGIFKDHMRLLCNLGYFLPPNFFLWWVFWIRNLWSINFTGIRLWALMLVFEAHLLSQDSVWWRGCWGWVVRNYLITYPQDAKFHVPTEAGEWCSFNMLRKKLNGITPGNWQLGWVMS